MKRYKIIVCALVVLLLAEATTGNAQGKVQKGDKSFGKLAYSDAIARYEKLLLKNPANLDALMKLAQCYRLTNENTLLEKTYARMMKVQHVPIEQKYNYALALIGNAKYDEARLWLQQFVDSTGDLRATAYLRVLQQPDIFYQDSSHYKIEKLAINSLNADFSPALYKDGIVFASSRNVPGLITREHSWTGKPFLSLYYSKGSESDFREPVTFSRDLKTKYNDGPVCFNKSGEVIYITRNNIESGRVKKDNKEVVKLKIFEAQNNSGNWKKITGFPYNSNEYNCAHPGLSPDEKTLYFSSDMPGGFGGMDLYACLKENGKWGKPKNLGPAINTSGNDIFPYLHQDGTLFFASDGHTGMGGLDIYSSKSDSGEFKTIKNIGAPVNSYDDDFALMFDNTNKTGYFCSNRGNRGGDDDIYAFTRTLTLKGIVVDRNTGKSIESATVMMNNPTTGKQIVTTLDDGKFSFPVDFNQEYQINGTKINMGEDNETLSTTGMSPADDPFVILELGIKAPVFTLRVNVRDESTGEPIEMAVLKVDPADKLLGNTNPEGTYAQDLAAGSDMKVMISKRGYSSKIISVSNTGLTDSKDFVYDVLLKRGLDLEGLEDWHKIIYYDLDKYNIRPGDAIPTLNEVVAFMKENPRVIIRLSAHTDSRASQQYNILLSKRRAISAKIFLVDHGISANRIADIAWSGETILVNDCGDKVFCPEPDHQLNRRTEITVKSLKSKK